MDNVLNQIEEDLITLRGLIPLNDRRSKQIIKRVNWALKEIIKAKYAKGEVSP